MRVPTIPPYTPLEGITQSPARAHHRRSPVGILSSDEKRIEALYLPQALDIVRRMWGITSVDDIALEIYHKTQLNRFSVRLVYALKARLDTIERNRAK